MNDIQENRIDDTNLNSRLGVGGEFGDSNMFYGALPIHFELAKKLRDNQTEAEISLWNQLAKIKGVRFKRQHPILYFIADFYCHKAKLIIEVDGGYHKLAELGLKVIRFSNEEVMNNIETVFINIEKEIFERITTLNLE